MNFCLQVNNYKHDDGAKVKGYIRQNTERICTYVRGISFTAK